jgi:hypothetical protein
MRVSKRASPGGNACTGFVQILSDTDGDWCKFARRAQTVTGSFADIRGSTELMEDLDSGRRARLYRLRHPRLVGIRLAVGTKERKKLLDFAESTHSEGLYSRSWLVQVLSLSTVMRPI